MSFFDTTILGNTVIDYFIAIGILVLGIFVGWGLYFLFKKVFIEWTKKTKTKIDTVIVSALKMPAMFFAFYIGFNIAYRTLSFTPDVTRILSHTAFIILVFTVTMLLRNIVVAVIQVYMERRANGKKSKKKSALDLHLFQLIKLVINIFIFIIAFIYVIDNLGFQITTLVAGLGIGGLALALAAQDTLKNLFGGITLYMDKPFQIGDRVKLDEQRDGFVKEIGLRSTRIETFAGTQIIIPNSRIADSILENISREKSRRINMTIGVEYSTPPTKVKKAMEIVKAVVKENEDTEDRSLVSFTEFGASSLNILVIYWIKNMDNILGARNSINMEIKKRFDKAGIGFAFPSTTVYLKKTK